MDVIAGRKTDHLVASDGTYRHALSLIYKLRANDGIARFQVRQAVDRSVEVRVAVRSGVKLDRKRVLEDVRECIGPDVPAELRVVDGIGFESSGKFRQVVSQAVQ